MEIMDLHQKFESISYAGTLPAVLQGLVDTIDAQAIGYPKRRQDVEQLEGYLAAGDHTLAKDQATLIIQRQVQFKHIQESGIPDWLELQVRKMEAEAHDYLGRNRDISLLSDYLAAGDIALAKLTLSQIIERQSNLRNRMVKPTDATSVGKLVH